MKINVSIILVLFFAMIPRMVFADVESLRVGVIAPLSGPVASMGQSLQGAFKMIDSKAVTFSYQDDQCDAKKALSSYLLLAQQGVRVFYAACSGSVLALAPRARADGNLLLTSYAGSIEIRAMGSEVIRFNPDAVSSVEAVVTYLKQNGALEGGKRVALFYEVQDYAASFAKLFQQKLGAQIGYVDNYKSTDGSFKTQILKLIGSKLSPIVFVPTSDLSARIILKEMHDLGGKGPVVGEENLCDYPFALSDFGITGACFKAAFSGEKYQRFLSSYKEKNGRDCQYPFYDAITYDIGVILGKLAPDALRSENYVETLRQRIMAGVEGDVARYAFDGHGEVVDGGQYLQLREFK